VEGRIFRPLSLTYSFALAGALVFALTVVPALLAIVLRPKDADVKEPKALQALRDRYARVLEVLLVRRRWPALLALVLLAGGVGVGSRLGSEFLPELDEGDLHVYVEMPASVSLEHG